MEFYDYLTEYIKKPQGFIKNLPIEILTIKEGYIKAKLLASKENGNPFGTIHGGLYFAVADTVAGTAAMTHGKYVTTTSGHIHYLKGASVDEPLIIETTEIKAGNTLLTYDVTFYSEREEIVCKVTLEYYALSKIQMEK